MSARTFGIAIVGTGIMGRRMMKALAPHPRFRVVGLWDPDAQALAQGSIAMPEARRATDLADLVTNPRVDVVYVASPPATHLASVRAALAAGRACLCEKPLAADVDEARALHDLVLASALPFAVNFPLASGPASRRLVQLVRAGDLGDIESASITARFSRWPRAWQAGASAWLAAPAEGGFTREVLSHFVFLAARMFGPARVAEVDLTRGRDQAETALRATLVHAATTVAIDGAVAGDAADHNRFEVIGGAGRAALVDWARLERDGAPSDDVDASVSHLDRVAWWLDGRSDHDLATVDEALSVVRCIEAMLAS